MLKQLPENALNVRYRISCILLISLLAILMSVAQANGKRRSISDTITKPPCFKLMIFSEKTTIKLGEDLPVNVLLKNVGDGNGVVSTLFFNDYSTSRVPKNSIIFDVKDSNGNQLVQNKDKVYYPQYAQATLKSFYTLSPDDIIGFQVNLAKDENFLYSFNKVGAYSIQATLETECRKYVEERIKAGAIKESELGSDPKKTLEKFINGTFKSNTIQIEVQK